MMLFDSRTNSGDHGDYLRHMRVKDPEDSHLNGGRIRYALPMGYAYRNLAVALASACPKPCIRRRSDR